MKEVYRYLILLFGIFSLASCSENKWVEIRDDNSSLLEKYMIHKSGTKNGPYEAFYQDGTLKEEANYNQGLLNGVRKLYYENGTLEIEENYENDVLIGEYKNFAENGQLLLSSYYVKGVMEGLLTRYDSLGNKIEEVEMKDNQENGSFREYHSNGQLHWEGSYLNGDNEFGELKEYDEQGVLLKKMMCDSLAVCRTVWTKDKGVVVPKY